MSADRAGYLAGISLGTGIAASSARPRHADPMPGLSLDEQERVVHALGGRHRIDDEVIGHIESVLFRGHAPRRHTRPAGRA